MSGEVKIQRSWLESLLRYAEQTRDSIKDSPEISVRFHIAELLGYISSAETIIKIKDKTNPQP